MIVATHSGEPDVMPHSGVHHLPLRCWSMSFLWILGLTRLRYTRPYLDKSA